MEAPVTCHARFEWIGDPEEEDLDAGTWNLDAKTDSEA